MTGGTRIAVVLQQALDAVEVLGASWRHRELGLDHLTLAALATPDGLVTVAACTDTGRLERHLERRLEHRDGRGRRPPKWTTAARDAHRVAERMARRLGRHVTATDLIAGVLEVGEPEFPRGLVGRFLASVQEPRSWLADHGVHAAAVTGMQRYGLETSHRIVLYNDHRTSMELVIAVLSEEFGMAGDPATRLMLHAHRHGWATVGIHPAAAARQRVTRAHARIDDVEAALQIESGPLPAAEPLGQGTATLWLSVAPGAAATVAARALQEAAGVPRTTALRAALQATDSDDALVGRCTPADGRAVVRRVEAWAETHDAPIAVRLDGLDTEEPPATSET